jgi:integrase
MDSKPQTAVDGAAQIASRRVRTHVAGRRARPVGRCYRFDRDFSSIGVGHIRRSSNAWTKADFERRNQLLTKLARTGQVSLLKAFANGTISIEELLDADDRNRLGEGLDAIALRRDLWVAMREVTERMGPTETTRKRYELSLNAFAALTTNLSQKDAKLKAAGKPHSPPLLDEHATVESPLHLDWNRVKSLRCFEQMEEDDSPATSENGGKAAGRATPRRKAGRRSKPKPIDRRRRSEADWNHFRRALSRFLSLYFKSKKHSIRHSILELVPHGKEPPGKDPQFSDEDFQKILDQLPIHLQPVPIALVLTGMRRGEYLACTKDDLDPSTCTIRVPGTKTAGSTRTVHVEKPAWPTIEAAIPSPLAYKALRQHWQKAVVAAFGQRVDPVTKKKVPAKHITLHDLRRTHARWALEAGVSLAALQHDMGHESPSMTIRYARTLARREVAAPLARRVEQIMKKPTPTKTTSDSTGPAPLPAHEAVELHRRTLEALGLTGLALEAAMAPILAITSSQAPNDNGWLVGGPKTNKRSKNARNGRLEPS